MRIFLFCIIVLIGLFLPLWAFACAAFVYALVYTPYEILILAMCIDAQFGDPQSGLWFLYTLTSSCILIVTVYLKPQLRLYS